MISGREIASSQKSFLHLMDVMREWRSKRGRHRSHKYIRNLTGVAFVLIVLSLFLVTISLQMAPDKYVSSNTAIRRTFLEDAARDITSVDSIWDWMDNVVAK